MKLIADADAAEIILVLECLDFRKVAFPAFPSITDQPEAGLFMGIGGTCATRSDWWHLCNSVGELSSIPTNTTRMIPKAFSPGSRQSLKSNRKPQ